MKPYNLPLKSVKKSIVTFHAERTFVLQKIELKENDERLKKNNDAKSIKTRPKKNANKKS